MEYSDIQKIKRLLRQLRAKLHPLSTAAQPHQHPSSSTSSLPTKATTTKDFTLLKPRRNNVTFKQTRGGASRRTNSALSAPTTSAEAPKLTRTASSTDSYPSTHNLTTPLRRHALSLQDHFKDCIPRLCAGLDAEGCSDFSYSTGPNSNPGSAASSRESSPIIFNDLDDKRETTRSVPSLATLAAFALGKSAPDVTSDAYEDGGVELEEEFYEEIPEFARSTVLISHITHLLTTHIPHPSILQTHIQTTLRNSLPLQTYILLLHHHSLSPIRPASSYTWSLNFATQIHKRRSFLAHVADTLTVAAAESVGFGEFVGALEGGEAGVLCVGVFEALVREGWEGEAGSVRERVVGYVKRGLGHFVDRGCQVSEWKEEWGGRRCRCRDGIVRLCEGLERVRGLGEDVELGILVIGVLALCEKAEVGSAQSKTERDQYQQIIRSLSSYSLETWHRFSLTPYSLNVLWKASQSLLSNEYHTIALRLLVLLVNRWEEFSGEGRDVVLSSGVSKKRVVDLVAEVQEVVDRSGGGAVKGRGVRGGGEGEETTKWRYEEMLDSYILATPGPVGAVSRVSGRTSPPPAPVLARAGSGRNEEGKGLTSSQPTRYALRQRGSSASSSPSSSPEREPKRRKGGSFDMRNVKRRRAGGGRVVYEFGSEEEGEEGGDSDEDGEGRKENVGWSGRGGKGGVKKVEVEGVVMRVGEPLPVTGVDELLW
ncbi:hypothetical protein HDV00_009506 [Rhizophlyctis rosea]|nr:hypothetical protein HDV00_009506 [Rhizophlyctis rosea]